MTMTMTMRTMTEIASLSRDLDRLIRVVGEMKQADLDTLEGVLERGLIHVMVERQLRVHTGVSALRPVS
jgi:hypothetical protein